MNDKVQEQLKKYNQLFKEQDDFYRKAAQWAGLSDAAHWILYRLCVEQTDMLQSQLCKEWFFSKQTINSAVAKLVQLEYVELKTESGKGNRKQVSVTNKGQKFCKTYVVPIIEAEENSFEILTDEERETMIRLMRKQLTALNQGVEDLWK